MAATQTITGQSKDRSVLRARSPMLNWRYARL